MKVIHSFFLHSSCFSQRISNLADKESKCVSSVIYTYYLTTTLIQHQTIFTQFQNYPALVLSNWLLMEQEAASSDGTPPSLFAYSLSPQKSTTVAHMVGIILKHTSDQNISVALWGHSLNCAGSVIWCRMLSRWGPCWLHFCWLLHAGYWDRVWSVSLAPARTHYIGCGWT